MVFRSVIFSLALLCVAAVGCGQSPLLNHANAKPKGAASAQDNTECPLSFPKHGLCASISWLKEPTEDTKGEFYLRFWKAGFGTEAGPYVTPENKAFVKLWMASMGHGSSPVALNLAKDQAGNEIAGVFLASDVFFVMPGEWEIWVQLKKDKQVLEQAKKDYTL